MGFFCGNNIHPYSEFLKRKKTMQSYSEMVGLNVIFQKEYEMEKFLQNVVFRESNRCLYCYHDRLKATAHFAKRGRFDFFTTSLLYSKFQKHEQIKSIGHEIEKVVGVPFYYEDFRTGWKEGILESKQLGLYRQQYCGCIYSEKERFFQP